jgi:large subunit ribosomal protein L15
MKQNSLKPTPGSKHSKKRVGRGGHTGTYSGRAMKGQKARTVGGVRVGFEGGQTPLLRRMPKLKGFRNPNKVYYFPINVGTLEKIFDEGAKIDAKALVEKGVLKKEQPLKLLGNGDLNKKLEITVDLASASATKKVEKAGGKLTILKAKAEKPAKADKES